MISIDCCVLFFNFLDFIGWRSHHCQTLKRTWIGMIDGFEVAASKHKYLIVFYKKCIETFSKDFLDWQNKTTGFHCDMIYGLAHQTAQRTQSAAYVIGQRGPTTFDLRATLRKRNNLRATSNKFVYKTTDSQDLNLKLGR